MDAKKAVIREVERFLGEGQRLGLIDDTSPIAELKKALPKMSLVALAKWHTQLQTSIKTGQKIEIRRAANARG